MRGLICLVAVTVAVVCQLTIVDRIAFPGGTGPDLVLILLAALALAGGPLIGALTGFWAGLALDVAPPGSHFTGQNALVFSLVGYACGLLADEPSGDGMTEQGHTALFEIVVTAVGAICGEALAALLGVMLSDPRVTWSAITHVLPVAAAYDVVACPFVLYAAAAALRLAGARSEGGRGGWSPAPTRKARLPRTAWTARTAPLGAGPGAVRPAGAGSTPRLRLSAGGQGKRWPGGAQGAAVKPAPKREPRLKLGRGSLAGGGIGTALAAGGSVSGPAKVRFAARRREGVLGGSLLGTSPYRGGSSAGSGLARTRMGRSLLGGSVFSRSPASPALGRKASLGGTALLGRPLAPRFSRGKALSQLTGALRRSVRPRSPGRGWLRRTSSRPGALGRGAAGWRPGATVGRRASRRRMLGGAALGRRPVRGARTGRPARLRMPRRKAMKPRRLR